MTTSHRRQSIRLIEGPIGGQIHLLRVLHFLDIKLFVNAGEYCPEVGRVYRTRLLKKPSLAKGGLTVTE
ncbi:hypothetical protein COMA2_10053 [Candidatus Nitrospira nitrificans]|uniref:Uncharacterized protein n=1 Tax=Candidatus Nitrospira nitrificans TaxID=1742973 RepID=A0A0S4L2C3_9BACT|nr:hypothetical protein COMA2_10053 [Candidatus Nitrospira nitrificans]